MKKTVLITGCSSGIGHELATALNRMSWNVVATARNVDALSQLAKQGCAVYPLDVTDFKQMENTVNAVTAKFGAIDLLINNAGYGLINPLMDISDRELHRQFEVNFFGVAHLTQLVVPVMKANGSGKIVNIGSISGIAPTPFAGAYCATKAALHAWSDSLRMELLPFGIRVILVQAGAIASKFGDNAQKSAMQLFHEESWYKPVEENILQRANTSQEKSTPVEVFVGKILRKILKDNPTPIIRTGKKSFYLPFIKHFLPTQMLDKIMIRKFGLKKL